ncbi:hypothetical protein RI367_003145 [Sorochytrium milnesiophthora]
MPPSGQASLPRVVKLNDLLAAVLDGDASRLQTLLQAAPADINLSAHIAKGKALLHLAVEQGSLPLVRALLPYAPNCSASSALAASAAASNGAGSENGDVSSSSFEDDSVVEVSPVRQLPQLDVNVGQAKRLNTPLHFAVKRRRLDLVRALVEEGNARIDVRNEAKATPLHMAAYMGCADILRFLVEKAVTVATTTTTTTTQRRTRGAAQNARSVTAAAAAAATQVNLLQQPDADNWCPIHAAIYSHSMECVNILVEHGADINQIGHRGWSTVLTAVYSKDLAICKRLVELGAEVNVKDEQGITALHTACELGLYDVAKFLLENGADVQAKDHQGWTPLHSACWSSSVELVKLLAQDFCADTSQLTHSRSSCLDLAVESGRIEVATWLLTETECKCVALPAEMTNALAARNTNPASPTGSSTETADTPGSRPLSLPINASQVVGNMIRVINEIGSRKRSESVQGQSRQAATRTASAQLSTARTGSIRDNNIHLLTSFMDSHFGSIMDELLLNDKATSFLEVADKMMSRQFDCTALVRRLQSEVPKLMGPDATSIVHALDSVQQLQLANKHIDAAPLIEIILHTLCKHVSDWADQQAQIEQLNAEELVIRSSFEDANKVLADCNQLIGEKRYLDALDVEDMWMHQMVDVLTHKSDLLKRCELVLRRQRQLCAEMCMLASQADADTSKLKVDLELQVDALTERLTVLSTFKERVAATVDRVRQEWTEKCLNTPWLVTYLTVYKEQLAMAQLTDEQAVHELLTWYVEEKAGEALREHTKITSCLSALHIHIGIAQSLRSNVVEPCFSHVTTALNFQINALQGQCTILQSDIPQTYLSLHARLVVNERLCSTNLSDLQYEMDEVLAKKNRAFENRRVGDLARFQELETDLVESLNKEKTRLQRIEDMIVSSFGTVSQHTEDARQEELRRELLEAGYQNAMQLGTTRKRKRAAVESDDEGGQQGAPVKDASIADDQVRLAMESAQDSERAAKRQRKTVLDIITWPIKKLASFSWSGWRRGAGGNDDDGVTGLVPEDDADDAETTLAEVKPAADLLAEEQQTAEDIAPSAY